MDRSDESLDSLLDENGPRKLNASRSWRQFLLKSPIIPWILTAIFCSSTLFLSWRLHNSQSFSCAAADGSSPLDGVNACPAECQSTSTELAIRDTYETGFQTDFVPGSWSPSLDISIVQQHFVNDLRLNKTAREYYNEPPPANMTRYIGASREEVDAAWNHLLHDQYVAIEPDEVEQFDQDDRDGLDDGNQSYFELSVFHNLHCLNELRVAINRHRDAAESGSGYGPGGVSETVHLDHCIDRLRQAVECASDLTPVPMILQKDVPYQLWLGNGETHTCRNFTAIREWVAQRGKIKSALGERR